MSELDRNGFTKAHRHTVVIPFSPGRDSVYSMQSTLEGPVNQCRYLLVCLGVLASCGVATWTGAQQYPPARYQDMRWRMIGPFRGGRTRAAPGVPSQPTVFYVGQVNGGVWKSDHYGRTWNPIFDDQPTQSVGAIAVAPSDPQIVYVASGEGLQRPDLSVGDGIYRSANATPTASQTAALSALEKDDASVMARWRAITSTGFPAFNRKLIVAGLAIIELKAEPEPASESENEA